VINNNNKYQLILI